MYASLLHPIKNPECKSQLSDIILSGETIPRGAFMAISPVENQEINSSL